MFLFTQSCIFTDKSALYILTLDFSQVFLMGNSFMVKINNHPETGDEKLWASRDCCLPYCQDGLCFSLEVGHRCTCLVNSAFNFNLSDE